MSIIEHAERIGLLDFYLQKEAERVECEAREEKALGEGRKIIELENSSALMKEQMGFLEGTMAVLARHGRLEGKVVRGGWVVGDGAIRLLVSQTGEVDVLTEKWMGTIAFSTEELKEQGAYFLFLGGLLGVTSLIFYSLVTILVSVIGVKFNSKNDTEALLGIFGIMVAVSTLPLSGWLWGRLIDRWPGLGWRRIDIATFFRRATTQQQKNLRRLLNAQVARVEREMARASSGKNSNWAKGIARIVG